MTQTLATTRGRDQGNDLYLDSRGNLAIARDLDAILQACEHVAKAILGEMVLAVDQGIPYFETVWTGVPNFQQFSAALRAGFLGIEGVVEVVSLTVGQEADVAQYTAVIRTTFGEGAISG